MDYDDEVLREAYDICRTDRVLDIGCGTGQTTRDAARVATDGSALGVDTSAAMIARGRELAEAAGLCNVTFERGDAQVHRFAARHFDVAISRFGTMFFDDPIAAFANIRWALRLGGRLVMMVWQDHASNEWSVSIQQALAPGERVSQVAANELDPFSLSDPAAVERILREAGFTQARFTEVREPAYYGEDLAAAFAWIRGFSCTRDLLQRLDAASAERALDRLRETLAAHQQETGVWFDSRAWIVTAAAAAQ